MTDPARRRALLGTSALCVAGALPVARAQPARPRTVGWLGNGATATGGSQAEALIRGLTALGWREGTSFSMEYRWAEGRPERLPALVADLAGQRVDVLVVSGSDAIRAALATPTRLPVVFVLLVDPVAAGLVESLARPGGRATGVASQFEEIITKQLQLLQEAVPALARVGVFRRHDASPAVFAAVQAAARTLALDVVPLVVRDASDFDAAFRRARAERVGAVHVLPSPYVGAQRAAVIAAAAHHRLPACYELKLYVRDGGLMSYGPDLEAMFARAASYVDRIFKGARPDELAVERPATFELALNRRTAEALPLTLPASLLQRADVVIP